MNKAIERIRYIVSHNRIVLSGIAGAGLFFFSTPTLMSVIAGIPVLFAGEFLRTWSSGYINKNRSLAMSGPYSYTRNPLYVGNFLLALGFAVISWNPAIIAATVILFFTIYTPVIKWEEEKLVILFGEQYREYLKNVPRFLPRISPAYKGLSSEFDWGLVKKHREFNTWAAILLGILVFAIKTFSEID